LGRTEIRLPAVVLVGGTKQSPDANLPIALEAGHAAFLRTGNLLSA
jgi:hypothetical protein